MTTFNSAPRFVPMADGKATFAVGASADFGQSVSMQADGKILVAGYSKDSSGRNSNSAYDFSVVRLNADGTLDTSFSGDGKATFDIGGDCDVAYSVTVQADGKILIAGLGSTPSTSTDFSVIRLNASGTLDTSFSFSGDGKVTVDTGGSDGQSMSVQADGKILMAGSTYNGSSYDFSVIRLNANGTLDTSFSDDGKAIFDVDGAQDLSYSLTLQADGKILIAGNSESSSTLSYEFSVIRLNANGTLDTSFSGDGKVILPLVGVGYDFGRIVKVQADGRILLAGTCWNAVDDYDTTGNYDFGVIRLNSNGSLDSSFRGGGKAVFDIGGYDDHVSSVNVQADGKILVAGTSKSSSGNKDFSVIRLNVNGTLDTSFSGDGKATFAIGAYEDSGFSLTVQADGKILLAGTSYSTSSSLSSDFALIRLNADGTLDSTFGDKGGSVRYTEGRSPVALDATVGVYDAELAALNSGAGNYSGASVTFSRHGGASSQDVFSGKGSLSLSAGLAVLSGITVGTVSNSGGILSLTFNANATQARVNETLSSIGYANLSNTPPASVQIDWVFRDGNAGAQGDGGALAVANSTRVDIIATNDAPTGNVIITNTVSQGQTLTVSNTLADADGLGAISYQWLRDGLAILGATASSYTATSADINRPISVRATYTDAFGTAESVTSSLWLQGGGGNDTLLGSDGNDTLNGGSGADWMEGGEGSDTYYVDSPGDGIFDLGSTGVDRVYSYASAYTLNDDIENGTILTATGASLSGNWLHNLLIGGAGNDTLNGGDSTDTMSGGDGSDIYYVTDLSDKVIETNATAGTGGIDHVYLYLYLYGETYTLSSNVENGTIFEITDFNLSGNNLNNRLVGGAGDNILNGRDGADTMVGGDGGDQYFVDDTGDTVIEADVTDYFHRVDKVYSYLDDYTLTAYVENGRIMLATGASLTGNSLNNSLSGGAGNDTLNAKDGNDSLSGGAGKDTLDGGDGADAMSGGDGSDTYRVDNVSDKVIETDATASTGGIDQVYTYLSAYKLGSNVENGTVLSSTASTLSGNSLANTLTAGTGDDTLNGGLGSDRLNGGTGHNTLNGGDGIDTMTGGDGSDRYSVNDVGDKVIEMNAIASNGGIDYVYSYLSAYTLSTNVENGRIMLDTGARLTGNSLGNAMSGGTGNDTLNGGLGNDSLSGSAGSDTLNGGDGADKMLGGDGSDTYYADNTGDSIIEGTGAASGIDRVNSYLGSYTLGTNVEDGRILATGTASLTGNSLNNVLYAGSGGNALDGDSGIDTVSYQYASAAVTVSLVTTTAQATGGSGSDTLLNVERLTGSNYADSLTGNTGSNVLGGDEGNDILNGGAGNDMLIGGLGADRLTGGTGADRFDFNVLTELGLSSTTRDTILDFKASEADKIDLLAVDANSALAGDQAFAFLGSLGTFSGDATGKLRFDAVNHILYGSTDADIDAEFAITLTGVSSLTSADLVL